MSWTKLALEMDSRVHGSESVGIELTAPLYAPDPIYSPRPDLKTQTFVLLMLVPVQITRRISRLASLSSCWWSPAWAAAADVVPELLLPAWLHRLVQS
jgi:hypothetical protein